MEFVFHYPNRRDTKRGTCWLAAEGVCRDPSPSLERASREGHEIMRISRSAASIMQLCGVIYIYSTHLEFACRGARAARARSYRHRVRPHDGLVSCSYLLGEILRITRTSLARNTLKEEILKGLLADPNTTR